MLVCEPALLQSLIFRRHLGVDVLLRYLCNTATLSWILPLQEIVCGARSLGVHSSMDPTVRAHGSLPELFLPRAEASSSCV